MASVKKNFGYNLILTVCNYLFPLITYPYVSRVLGVENIGTCNFVDSIVNYFILFAQLGIGSYGVREIARCKNNRDRCNEVFSNLFAINTILSFLAIVALIVCTYIITFSEPYKQFLWVGILKLLFTLFLIEWFFQGIEQFKYITIRSVIVRCIYVVCVFLFVHDTNDALIYYTLTSLTIVINALWNWNYSRRFRTLSFKNLSPQLYIVPILTFGYYRILTSMYTTFNVAFLGFVKDNAEVGYFTTATKLYGIILSVFTAFTTVMIPRVSYMLEQGEKQKLQDMANKILSLLVSLSIPMILFCVFNAPAIILLIAGEGYEGAITPFRIVIFLLLIIGMEQIIIQQFIMASKKTKLTFIVSTVGAIVGLSLNLLFTPRMGSVGSAISWGCSEFMVLLTGIYFLSKHLHIHIGIKNLFIPLSLGVIYLFPLLLCKYYIKDIWICLLFSVFFVLLLL